MKYQSALSSMDLIAVLNNKFTGKVKNKELSNRKVARFLNELGYIPYATSGTVEEIETWLEENDGAYANEVWFEELNSNNLDKNYTCIFDIIAKYLGLRFRSIPSLYIGDYDGIDTDTGITTSIQCEDEQQADYVRWWCMNFGIDYIEDETLEFGLKDFAEENEMAFLFLYENGKLIDSCAIDWASGYDNVTGDMAQTLADRDVDNKFSKYANSDKATNIIKSVMEMISSTKEVVF